MPTLVNFINNLNYQHRPYVGSQFLFEWPGVFPVLGMDKLPVGRFGCPIVINVNMPGVDHQQLKMYIDGHEIPVNGIPILGKEITFETYLEQDFINKSYGSLLNMIYLNDTHGTSAGFGQQNFIQTPGQMAGTEIGQEAKLYTLAPNYDANTYSDYTANPHFVIKYPKVKTVDRLTFTHENSQLIRLRITLIFAYFTLYPGNNATSPGYSLKSRPGQSVVRGY